MWELNHKESWVPKNWCFLTVVLEKTLESPLDSKEIKSVNPKGNQSWIFIGRTDAEVPLFRPQDAKSQLIGKYTDAWKDWEQEEKRVTEDEMVGWHHQLNGHEFEQTPGDGKGQGSLACCSSWSLKESDMTEWLKSNNRKKHRFLWVQVFNLLSCSRWNCFLEEPALGFPAGFGHSHSPPHCASLACC